MSRLPNTIYIDARALQDPNYRFRGVGQHSTSLLRAMRRHDWKGRRPALVALLDPAREGLHISHQLLFDRTTHRPGIGTDAGPAPWLLSLSPMTHDPVWIAEILSNDSVFKAALFYDLIPLEIPERYLTLVPTRSEYIVALAWLRRYDRFAAISKFTADTLIDRMSVAADKVFVSGVAVRGALEPLAGSTPLPFAERDTIVVAGGGDPRKNPECAIAAHARSKLLRQHGIRLQVFGAYPAAMREQFRLVYAENGGRPQDLVFLDHLSDADLHSLYRRSKATVVASRAEGFSIPIVESSAAGTPAIVSDVGAHPELITDPAWRFGPDDVDTLQRQLEAVATDEPTWNALVQAQTGLWERYTEKAVGSRLIDGLLTSPTTKQTSPFVRRNAKPNLAILSPLPPAHSGVADYTAATLRPLKKIANLYMFTSTVDARWEEGWAGLGSVASASLSSTPFDATVCVLGNSFHHRQIHDHLMDHGGACIAHDARQIDYYFHEHGPQYAAELAQRETGRDVDVPEVTKWLLNQRELPTLFLSDIVAASSPLMVHSATTAQEIARLYKTTPVVLPFAQYSETVLDRLDEGARRAARERLGLRPEAIVLVTFGIVSNDKAPHEILFALGLLRRWGLDVDLVFCGMAPPDTMALIKDMSTRLELTDHVHTFTKAIDAPTYRDYLIAADVGIQLRTYFMGGLSGALNDCIAAALPSIANQHLAEAMQAPAFVRRIPDGLSSLLIGEAVLEIITSGDNLRRPIAAAERSALERSPEAYCAALLRALEIDVPLAATAVR